MVGYARQHAKSALAYEAIKDCLLAYELPPGSPIPVVGLAALLRLSTEPVQAACHRLVDEGWLIEVGLRGYIAWNPDKDVLRGLYTVSEELLLAAIRVAATKPNPPADGVRKVREALRRGGLPDHDVPARTAELFSAIVAMGGDANAKGVMDACGERLYFLRILESLHLEDVNGELIELCESAWAGRPDALKGAVEAYFLRRHELVPNLVRFVPARA